MAWNYDPEPEKRGKAKNIIAETEAQPEDAGA